MMNSTLTPDLIRAWLAEIPDPEVPAISIVDLGIVRAVEIEGDRVRIDITPTYSGCPAMRMIQDQIGLHLREKGIGVVDVRLVAFPAWTTDWMSEDARRKLKEYGIAPPGWVRDEDLFDFKPRPVSCPFCDSDDTARTSEFGSTPCKSLWFCHSCRQPFEHFKCH